MTQAMPTSTPPPATTSFGPRRGPSASTSQPPAGVSQVSSAMKMLNDHWISATDQPRAWRIGCTNSVQPYCRLAISIMQMTPNTNCHQRGRCRRTPGFPFNIHFWASIRDQAFLKDAGRSHID